MYAQRRIASQRAILDQEGNYNYSSVTTPRPPWLHWTWDPNKDAANRRKHGLSFETAQLVFDDPLAMSQPDPASDGERWRTVGIIGHVAVFVIHTWPEAAADESEATGRIISARKATSHERRAYEEGST